MAETKILTLEGLQVYTTESMKKMDAKDTAKLSEAKAYADSLAVNYDPAGTAQTKVDELKNGQVATNKNNIVSLQTSKADKATTLAGYGIADAYTKAQADSKIATEIAKAPHLKRTIVEVLPSVDAADENTIYMILKSRAEGQNQYDEYMIVNKDGVKSLEKIGDSAVDLTNYATKTEVANAKSEAINTAATDATSKANKALNDAKAYSDSLSKNYATAAQGAKADTALQKASITTGATNGSIAVSGTDVPVKGLGSAAYTEATAYEKAGAVDALSKGQVTTNKNDITAIKSRLDVIEMVSYVEITDEEIKALFQ